MYLCIKMYLCILVHLVLDVAKATVMEAGCNENHVVEAGLEFEVRVQGHDVEDHQGDDGTDESAGCTINFEKGDSCGLLRFACDSVEAEDNLDNFDDDDRCSQNVRSAHISIDDKGLTLDFNSSEGKDGLKCLVSCYSKANNIPCECGVANRGRRIVGGSAALVHEFPWQVALVDPDLITESSFATGYMCGGVLINKEYVLSAAHCLHGSAPHWTNVVVGEHDISTMSETNVTTLHHIKRLHIHPKYNSTTANHDLALIQLDPPIKEYSDKIRPVCLPSKPSNQVDQVLVTGWGSRNESWTNDISPVLQKVLVPRVERDLCETQLKKFDADFVLTDNMLCAGLEEGGKDACFGDSGGPALAATGHPDHYEVIGITSFGKGCARAQAPGVYADVYEMLDWITSFVTLQDSECPSRDFDDEDADFA